MQENTKAPPTSWIQRWWQKTGLERWWNYETDQRSWQATNSSTGDDRAAGCPSWSCIHHHHRQKNICQRWWQKTGLESWWNYETGQRSWQATNLSTGDDLAAGCPSSSCIHHLHNNKPKNMCHSTLATTTCISPTTTRRRTSLNVQSSLMGVQ